MGELGLADVGETTDDKRFTLVELECLGSCGTAPVALVNDVLHENITLESIADFIRTLPEDPHDYGDPSVDFEVPVGNPPGAGTLDLAGKNQAPAGGG